jgi:hypothetical protein
MTRISVLARCVTDPARDLVAGYGVRGIRPTPTPYVWPLPLGLDEHQAARRRSRIVSTGVEAPVLDPAARRVRDEG